MGYILELRKQVGHRPLIMTCAGVLLLNEKRELLLQKRADNGLWGYPGGSMELGESFKDCARREVREETGFTVNADRLIAVQDWRKHNVQNYAFGVMSIQTGMKFMPQKRSFYAGNFPGRSFASRRK